MSEKNKNHRPPGGHHGGFGRPVEKPKNFRGTLKRLIRYLRPHKVNLIIVLVFAIGSTAFTIAAPRVTSLAINKLQDAYMARAMLQHMSEFQVKAVEQINQIQRGPHADQNQQLQGEPQTIDAVQDFINLPLLSSVQDAGQKAEIVQKMIELGQKMPVNEQIGRPNVEFSQDQINGAVGAIRETNGEYDFHYIGSIVLLLLGIYVVSSGFSLIMGLVMSGVAQKTVREMRSEIDRKLAGLPLKYFDTHPHGDILSRVTNDIDTIATTMQQSLTQIITAVILIIGYVVMMLTISPTLTLVIIATLPLYIAATALIAGKSQKYFRDQQKALGKLSGHVEEMYTGHKVVKAFGREKDAIEEFEAINSKLNSAGWKAQFVSGIMFPLMNFISNLGYVGISIAGSIWITRNILGLGDILAFIQYSRSFTMPIAQTANIANIIQSTLACAERVFEILDEEEEVYGREDAQVIEFPKGQVSFENVDFRYQEDVPLINNFNLEVKPGHTIAIVGPTGAGKTTLVNLLMRFYEINSGKISIDGVDIRDIRLSELRKMFGMVLQDTWLFNGTIKDNIAYGKPGATMKEVVRAAKAAHADRADPLTLDTKSYFLAKSQNFTFSAPHPLVDCSHFVHSVKGKG